MNMSDSGGALSVPSEHLPGLIALVLLGLILGAGWLALRMLAARRVGWAETAISGWRRLSFPAQAALLGLLAGAVVHAALVPTHWSEERTTALWFVVDVVGFAIAAAWTLRGRRFWPQAAAAMLGGTAAVYAWYLLTGREDPDLVGLLTTAVELAAALVVVWAVFSHQAVPAPLRRPRWIVTAAGAALIALIATSALAVSATSSSADTDAASRTSSGSGAAMAGMARSSAVSRPLSLATASPAGAITWPDDMSTMRSGMKMATPGCTSMPTAVEQRTAVDLVDRTVAAATPFESLAAAKAAGYVPVTPSGKRIVHYIDPAIYRQRPTLDPHKIPVLVYVNTRRGAVLSAAMYLMPATAARPPQPGGCLTQWHVHTDLCFSGAGVVGNDEGGGCGAGSSNRMTAPMMHVWLAPVSGGPLAPDPAARDEIIAANRLPQTGAVNGIA